MGRNDRLAEVIQYGAKFLRVEIFVRNHTLKDKAAVGRDVSEELSFSQFVIVGQQSQQRGTGDIGGSFG